MRDLEALHFGWRVPEVQLLVNQLHFPPPRLATPRHPHRIVYGRLEPSCIVPGAEAHSRGARLLDAQRHGNIVARTAEQLYGGARLRRRGRHDRRRRTRQDEQNHTHHRPHPPEPRHDPTTPLHGEASVRSAAGRRKKAPDRRAPRPDPHSLRTRTPCRPAPWDNASLPAGTMRHPVAPSGKAPRATGSLPARPRRCRGGGRGTGGRGGGATTLDKGGRSRGPGGRPRAATEVRPR